MTQCRLKGQAFRRHTAFRHAARHQARRVPARGTASGAARAAPSEAR
ncbi:TPA: hypothetical protein ACLT84_000155 [Neisseria gonorrhoeae]